MHQMLEQLKETRSKGDGPMVMGDNGVPTLEHRHDTVLPKRRNNTPSKGEIKGKDGFLPPREVGFEERIRKPIQTDSRVHTLSQCVTQFR